MPSLLRIADDTGLGLWSIFKRNVNAFSFNAIIDVRRQEMFLPLDETVASRAVFVIVSASVGRADGLAEPAK